jgi:hypothetical protein
MVVSLIVKLLEEHKEKEFCGNKSKRSVNAFKSLNANILVPEFIKAEW